MILILNPTVSKNDDAYQTLIQYLEGLPGIRVQSHVIEGEERRLTELYLLGATSTLDAELMAGFEAVDRVIRVSEEYRILGLSLIHI